jgi:tetratricopeptide (TPR) repeat protein
MITNFRKQSRYDDAKFLTRVIFIFLFVLWLCTPPGNKFIQVCFWGNNTRLAVAKLTNNAETTEWKFHRNNAVYLIRMENPSEAIKEMNKAINTYPVYMSETRLKTLYLERAQMRMFNKDYNGALSDYMRIQNLSLLDRFRVALMFKAIGNNNYALRYCNSILDVDHLAYAGYACLADVYAGVGKYDVAVRVYDLLIDRSSGRAKYYVDRAKYKKLCGDHAGYNEDIKIAKNMAYKIDLDYSIVRETLYPKMLDLDIMRN